MLTQDDNVHVLAEKLVGFNQVMLVTRGRDGSLKSRPMTTPPCVFDGSLWFFTSVSAEKAEEVSVDEQVCVTGTDTVEQRFVSLTGRAHVVSDRDKAGQLWTPALREWFDSVDDPALRLIRVDIDHAEYWNSADGTQLQLVGFSRTGAHAELSPSIDGASAVA